MSSGLDARERPGYIYRTRPRRERNALAAVIVGVAIALFAAGWTVLWFRNVDGVPMLCGIIGLVILVSGAKIALNAMQGGEAFRSFARNATTTHATVLDRFIEHKDDREGGDGSEIYIMVVRFVVDGQRLTLQAEVDARMYAESWRGQTLSVRYANTDPSIALLEGEW